MNHIHFKQCHSTQEYLKVQVDTGQARFPTLVSTSKQPDGVGRRGNKWICFENALAFSFLANMKLTSSLLPLEVGVHLCHFFLKKYQLKLKLKWPNDLLNKNQQKVGGIIIRKFNNCYSAGVGINLFLNENEREMPHDFDYQAGSLFDTAPRQQAKKDLPLEFYKHFLSHRYASEDEIIKEWNQLCAHINQEVTLTDDSFKVRGQFLGISEDGACIIESEKTKKKFYSGSIRWSSLENENQK